MAHESNVKLLKYSEIPTAIETGVSATQEDPLFRYLIWDTPQPNKWLRQQRYWLFYYLGIATAVRWHEGLTVDNGEALIILRETPLEKAKRETWLDRIWKIVHGVVVMFLFSFDTKERKQRRMEMQAKLGLALKETIAPRVPEMMNMDGESVAPEKRGLGYDSMLVEYAAAKADHLGHAIWSNSYSQARTSLYESFGFTTAATFTLGEDNPTWKKEPVLIRIMVREPRRVKS